jgi:hypothetical protein
MEAHKLCKEERKRKRAMDKEKLMAALEALEETESDDNATEKGSGDEKAAPAAMDSSDETQEATGVAGQCF